MTQMGYHLSMQIMSCSMFFFDTEITEKKREILLRGLFNKPLNNISLFFSVISVSKNAFINAVVLAYLRRHYLLHPVFAVAYRVERHRLL